jgi:hypothetical protein
MLPSVSECNECRFFTDADIETVRLERRSTMTGQKAFGLLAVTTGVGLTLLGIFGSLLALIAGVAVAGLGFRSIEASRLDRQLRYYGELRARRIDEARPHRAPSGPG